jgi:ketosteroid isomerase-like protein
LGQSFNINPNLALNTDAEEARAGHDALTFRSRSRHSLYSQDFVWWFSRRGMIAAAYEGKTVKQWLMDLARMRLAEMEKKGLLPKGK